MFIQQKNLHIFFTETTDFESVINNKNQLFSASLKNPKKASDVIKDLIDKGQFAF